MRSWRKLLYERVVSKCMNLNILQGFCSCLYFKSVSTDFPKHAFTMDHHTKLRKRFWLTFEISFRDNYDQYAYVVPNNVKFNVLSCHFSKFDFVDFIDRLNQKRHRNERGGENLQSREKVFGWHLKSPWEITMTNMPTCSQTTWNLSYCKIEFHNGFVDFIDRFKCRQRGTDRTAFCRKKLPG